MDVFGKIAERKIREALADGAFKDLPGKGLPLSPDEDGAVPSELKMAYKILKNAGVLPEELQVRKELLRLEDLIAICEDDGARREYKQKMTLMRLKLEILLEKSGKRLPSTYENRVYQKFS